MAIQEYKDTEAVRPPIGEDLDPFYRKGPHLLTAEESEHLLRWLVTPPAALTPEMKQAIANYKRIKAECVE